MKFTVAAPPYSDKSGGLWYCHFLCHTLNEIGHTAKLHLYEQPYRINYDWNTPLGHDPEAIVIYPEGVRNNPLNSKKNVRYFLAPEDFFGAPPIQMDKTDYLLTYSKAFRKDTEVLFRPNHDLDILKPSGKPTKFNSFYVGKGFRRQDCPPLQDCIEITRNYPDNKAELVKILQLSNIFYSYDEMSATNIDAALCGAMPYFLTKHLPFMLDYELGKFWIYSLDPEEVAQAKENHRTLRSRVETMQKEFPTKLAEICNKIEAHFKNIS